MKHERHRQHPQSLSKMDHIAKSVEEHRTFPRVGLCRRIEDGPVGLMPGLDDWV